MSASHQTPSRGETPIQHVNNNGNLAGEEEKNKQYLISGAMSMSVGLPVVVEGLCAIVRA